MLGSALKGCVPCTFSNGVYQLGLLLFGNKLFDIAESLDPLVCVSEFLELLGLH